MLKFYAPKLSVLIALMLCLTSICFARVVVVPQNNINGKNILQQHMLKEENVTYRIQYKFDLQGKTVFIPKGCELSFTTTGGINNGALEGQMTTVKVRDNKKVFCGILIKGKWCVTNVYSRWFDFSDNAARNTINFANLCALTDGVKSSTITIDAGRYLIKFDENKVICMMPKSNTTIRLNGTIMLEGNSLPSYRIIHLRSVNNVEISGNGKIVGDVRTHRGDEGEWGMGIWMTDCKNVVLRDITVCNCWGDCIYLGQSKKSKDSYSENILIDNVTCSGGRRQGLSIISGKNIRILNSFFNEIGSIKFTRPGHGIDIEPNDKGKALTEGILIDNCRFLRNKKSDFSTYNLDSSASITVKNCIFDRKVTFSHNSYNITMENCVIKILNSHSNKVNNIIIKNSRINGYAVSMVLPSGVHLNNCIVKH